MRTTLSNPEMNLIEWFAFDGLILPIAIMVIGGWLIHFGQRRPELDPDSVASLPLLFRFLVGLKAERPVGVFMVLSGLLVGMLRLRHLI